MPVSTRSQGLSVATVSPITSPETPSGRRAVYRRWPKPPYTYVGLIATAIQCEAGRRAPVSDIYEFFRRHFSFFRNSNYKGWMSSVRHMLSNKPCFTMVLKDPACRVHSKFWMVDVEQVEEIFLKRQNNDDTYAPYLHEHLDIPSIWELSAMTEKQQHTALHRMSRPNRPAEKRMGQQEKASEEGHEALEQRPRRKRTREEKEKSSEKMKGKNSRKCSEAADGVRGGKSTVFVWNVDTGNSNTEKHVSENVRRGRSQPIQAQTISKLQGTPISGHIQNLLPISGTPQDNPQNLIGLPLTGTHQDNTPDKFRHITGTHPSDNHPKLPASNETHVTSPPTSGLPVTLLQPCASIIYTSPPPPLVLPPRIEIPDDLSYIPDNVHQGEPALMLDNRAMSSLSPHLSRHQVELNCETNLELLADVTLAMYSSPSSLPYSSFNSSDRSHEEM